MAHNLHLVVIKANTPKDACNSVESFIEDWGTDNNWRTICGCVSENNEVFVNTTPFGSGRWDVTHKDSNTIAKINKMVKGWTKDTYYGGTAQNKIKKIEARKGKINLNKWTTSELWSLQRLAKHQYEINSLGNGKNKFNVLEDEFYSWEYDECGVTQCSEENGDTAYVVFVDMHS